jgi:hypothetical protein
MERSKYIRLLNQLREKKISVREFATAINHEGANLPSTFKSVTVLYNVGESETGPYLVDGKLLNKEQLGDYLSDSNINTVLLLPNKDMERVENL